MQKFLDDHRYGLLLFAIGLIHFVMHFVLHIDTFERLHGVLEHFEHYELDEIILVAILAGIGVVLDYSRSSRKKVELKKQAEDRAKAMQVTLRTVNDIVGNALNQLNVIQTEIELNDTVSDKSKDRLDTVIHTTKHELIRLSNTEEFVERSLGDGLVVLDYKSDSPDSGA